MERSEMTGDRNGASTALESSARHAYETGRWHAALTDTAFVLPVAAAQVWACGNHALAAVTAVLLVAAVLVARWRGRVWGRAAVIGVLAGAPSLALPFVMHASGHLCTMSGLCCTSCVAACVVAGLAGGGLVGVRTASLASGRLHFAAAACVMGALVGGPACAYAGALGVLGLMVGLTAGSAPVMLAPQPTR